MNLDAMDELDRARALIELAKMACRSNDEDLSAIAAGLTAAVDHLDRAAAGLNTASPCPAARSRSGREGDMTTM